jgi:multidrug efflux pump subunit AcrA (membrane-fusion protein)
MKRRGFVTVVILALIAIFALSIAFSYIQGRQPKKGAAQPAASAGARSAGATAVRVSEAASGVIENSIVINGDVLAGKEVSLYPAMAGRLAEARLKAGDTVRQGQTVAMIDPSRPGEVYVQSPVAATVSGTVMSAPLVVGDTVTTSSVIYTVGNLSELVVETFVPERFSTMIRRGLSAQVSFDAIPGERFSASVDEISPVIDPASRTLRIRLRFTVRDSRIRAGMFAQVSLVTNSRSDVLIIPRISIINTYGSFIVFVVDGNNKASRREISLGLESEEYVEVVSGLESGERVVTAGQNFLSDGDLLRIVE